MIWVAEDTFQKWVNMTVADSREIFITTPVDMTPEEVTAFIASVFEVSIDQWLASEECEFIASDREPDELSFTMSEKYNKGSISGPVRAYKVQVSVEAHSITRNKKH